MSIIVKPRTSVHVDTEVNVKETDLKENDKLVIINDEHLSTIEAFLADVERSVSEFRTKLENTIDINQLDKIKGQLGDLSLLPVNETIISCLNRIKSGLSLKADALEVDRMKPVLFAKADATEVQAVVNTIGNASISPELDQTIIGAINDIFVKMGTLSASLENYMLKNGDILNAPLSYRNEVRDFTNLEIPHVTWINNRLDVVIGHLDNLDLTNKGTIEECFQSLITSVNTLETELNTVKNQIGNLDDLTLPEENRSNLVSSINFLKDKIDNNETSIVSTNERITLLETNKADASVVESLQQDMELMKGAHVIIAVLNEEKAILDAMTEDARQLFLKEKAKEAGRKTLKDGYEIRTRDGFKYYYYKGTWYFVDNADVANATINSSGLIRFSEKIGYVTPSGEGDGTAKVVGLDQAFENLKVINNILAEKLDAGTYLENKRDFDAHLNYLDSEVETIKQVSENNKVVSNRADLLSQQNSNSITEIKNTVNNLDTDLSSLEERVLTNETSIEETKQHALNAKHYATISGEKSLIAEEKATEAALSAQNAMISADKVLEKVGDIDSITVSEAGDISEAINILDNRLLSIETKPEDLTSNENLIRVYNNDIKLNNVSIDNTNSVYTKPNMFVDIRGYFHLFAEYRETRDFNSKSEVVYTVLKNTKDKVSRTISLVNRESDTGRIESMCLAYDELNDTPYLLITEFNNELNWKENENWVNCKLLKGTWNSVMSSYDWNIRTIGRANTDIIINNLDNSVKSIRGGTLGLIHPENNEILLPVDWSDGLGNVNSAVLFSLDGDNWEWRTYGDVLNNIEEPTIYRNVIGSTDHIHLVGKSTTDSFAKVKISPNKGNTWENGLGLENRLCGEIKPSCSSATSFLSRTGRHYSLVLTPNVLVNNTRKQDRITLYLVSENSRTMIPVDTIAITGDNLISGQDVGYNFYSSIYAVSTMDGDKIYVHYETKDGTFLKDISTLIPKIEMLHDVYDLSNTRLTEGQKEEIESMIGDASLGGTGTGVDSITRKIKDLELFDKQVDTRLNEVKKMLEGSIKGMRFVGIASYTRREVEANKRLLTDFVNNRYSDPMEQLRTGDVVSTKDKFTYVYLRNEEGLNEWTDYNPGGDLGDILNRLSILEEFKTLNSTLLEDFNSLKAEQENINNDLSNKINDNGNKIEEIENKLGDFSKVNLVNNLNVVAMVNELSENINDNYSSIEDLDAKIGNLENTGLNNTSSVTECIKELNQNKLQQDRDIELKLNELREKDTSLGASIEEVKKIITISLKGCRFVGIIKRTKEEVEQDKELLTNFVNLKFADTTERLREGDIVSTIDKHTFVYLRNDSGDYIWDLYEPNDVSEKIDLINNKLEELNLSKTQLEETINSTNDRINNIISPDSKISQDIEDLKNTDGEIKNLIGNINSTGFNGDNVGDIIRDIKTSLTTIDVRDKIGDLDSTGFNSTNSVSEVLSEIKNEIEGTKTNADDLLTLINGKLDAADIDSIKEDIELLKGAHVVVTILPETKDEVEAEFDRDGFLSEKVIDAGKSNVENGYEIRTSDGYGYYFHNGRWYETQDMKITNASTSNPGLVKFKDEIGFLYSSSTDGTATIKGFTELKATVENVANSLNNKVNNSDFSRETGNLGNRIDNLNTRITEALTKTTEALTITAELVNKSNSFEIDLEELNTKVDNNSAKIGELSYTGLLHTDSVSSGLKELKDMLDDIALFNENEDFINAESFKLGATENNYGGMNVNRDIFGFRSELNIGNYNTSIVRIFRTNTNFPQLTVQRQSTGKINLSNWSLNNGEYKYTGSEPNIDISHLIDNERRDFDLEFSFNVSNLQNYSINGGAVPSVPVVDIVPCYTLLCGDNNKTTLSLSYKGRFNNVNENAFILYLNRLEILRLNIDFEPVNVFKDYYNIKLSFDALHNKIKLYCNNKVKEISPAGVNVGDLVSTIKHLVMFYSDVSETYTTTTLYFNQLKISGPKIDFVSRLNDRMQLIEELIGDLTKTGIPDAENDTVESSLRHLKNEIVALRELMAEAQDRANSAEEKVTYLEREIEGLLQKAEDLTERADRVIEQVGDMLESINKNKEDIANLQNNMVTTDMIEGKADKSTVEQLLNDMEIIKGAHVVVSILNIDKDTVEAKADKQDFLTQEVLDAGRPKVEQGYSIRTNDGYVYYYHEGTWYLVDKQVCGIATTTNLGLVKFKDEEGYISTGDGDGTSKVFGYDTLKQDVENNKQQIETNKNNIESLTTRVEDNENSIAQLENKTNQLEQTVNTLETKAGENADKIKEIQTQLGPVTGQTISDKLQQINTAISDFNNTLGDINNNNIPGDTLEDKLQSIEGTIGQITGNGSGQGTTTTISKEIETIKTELTNKADSSNVYDKTEVYNKTEVDDLLDNLQNQQPTEAIFLDGAKVGEVNWGDKADLSEIGMNNKNSLTQFVFPNNSITDAEDNVYGYILNLLFNVTGTKTDELTISNREHRLERYLGPLNRMIREKWLYNSPFKNLQSSINVDTSCKGYDNPGTMLKYNLSSQNYQGNNSDGDYYYDKLGNFDYNVSTDTLEISTKYCRGNYYNAVYNGNCSFNNRDEYNGYMSDLYNYISLRSSISSIYSVSRYEQFKYKTRIPYNGMEFLANIDFMLDSKPTYVPLILIIDSEGKYLSIAIVTENNITKVKGFYCDGFGKGTNIIEGDTFIDINTMQKNSLEDISWEEGDGILLDTGDTPVLNKFRFAIEDNGTITIYDVEKSKIHVKKLGYKISNSYRFEFFAGRKRDFFTSPTSATDSDKLFFTEAALYGLQDYSLKDVNGIVKNYTSIKDIFTEDRNYNVLKYADIPYKIGDMSSLETAKSNNIVSSINSIMENLPLYKVRKDNVSDTVIDRNNIFEEYYINDKGELTPSIGPVNRVLTSPGLYYWQDYVNREYVNVRPIRLKHIDTGLNMAAGFSVDIVDDTTLIESSSGEFAHKGFGIGFKLGYVDYETNKNEYLDLDTGLTVEIPNRDYGMPSGKQSYPIHLFNENTEDHAYSLYYKLDMGNKFGTSINSIGINQIDAFSTNGLSDWFLKIVYTGESTCEIYVYCNNKYLGKSTLNNFGYGKGKKIKSIKLGSFTQMLSNGWGTLVGDVKIYSHDVQEGSIGYNYAEKNIPTKSLEKAWYSGDSVSLDTIIEDFNLDNQIEPRYTDGLFRVLSKGYKPLPLSVNAASLSGMAFKHKTSNEKLFSIGTMLDVTNFFKKNNTEFSLELQFRYTDNISNEYLYFDKGTAVENRTLLVNKPTEITLLKINDGKLTFVFNTSTGKLSVRNGLTESSQSEVLSGTISKTALNKLYISCYIGSDNINMTLYNNTTKIGDTSLSYIGNSGFNSLYRFEFFPLEYYYGFLYKKIRMYKNYIPGTTITSRTYKSLEDFYLQNR